MRRLTSELKWAFILRILETVSISRSACLPSNFENLNEFPLDCYQSGIEINLRHFLDTALSRSHMEQLLSKQLFHYFFKILKTYYILNRLRIQ